jgi:hypothetical protein
MSGSAPDTPAIAVCGCSFQLRLCRVCRVEDIQVTDCEHRPHETDECATCAAAWSPAA